MGQLIGDVFAASEDLQANPVSLVKKWNHRFFHSSSHRDSDNRMMSQELDAVEIGSEGAHE